MNNIQKRKEDIKKEVLKEVEKSALSSEALKKRVVEEITMENNLIDEAIDLTWEFAEKEFVKMLNKLEKKINQHDTFEHGLSNHHIELACKDVREIKQKLEGK